MGSQFSSRIQPDRMKVLMVILVIMVQRGHMEQRISQLRVSHTHFLEGTVSIKDNKTIEIRNFSYPSTKSNPNGILGPDAFFIAGTMGSKPDTFLKRGNLINSTDIIIPLPFPQTGKSWQFKDSSIPVMRAVVDETIQLTLPPGVDMCDLKWLSLWCRRYRSNFGQVNFENCKL